MWNPFKKTKEEIEKKVTAPEVTDDSKSGIKDKFVGAGVNMMAKVAMKKIEKMSPKEKEKMMRQAFDPKNRDKMLAVMEQMKKAGQISDDQYRLAKQKLGL